MTARNAFEGLTTDSMLRRLLAALQFSRTSTDALRVQVDGGSLSNVDEVRAVRWGNSSVTPTHYGVGAPNSMDLREQQKTLTRTAAQQVRSSRWVI